MDIGIIIQSYKQLASLSHRLTELMDTIEYDIILYYK